MKTIIQIIVLIVSINVYSQLDANSVMGIPTSDTISEMESITPTNDGAVVFNKENEKLYVYIDSGTTTGNWRKIYLAPTIITASGNYELEPTDDGNIIVFEDSSNATLTIPDDLTSTFNVSVYQKGTGTIHIVEGSGSVNIINRLDRFYTAGQGAGIGIVALSDTDFYITGDLKIE